MKILHSAHIKLPKKQFVFGNKTQTPESINNFQDNDKYIKITKTQNTLNNCAWGLLIISAVAGIIKAISDMKKVPKI